MHQNFDELNQKIESKLSQKASRLDQIKHKISMFEFKSWMAFVLIISGGIWDLFFSDGFSGSVGCFTDWDGRSNSIVCD